MKRALITLALVLAMTSATAFANFSGSWSGNGGASFAPGNQMNCQFVGFQFNQGFQYFDILRGEAHCGGNRIYYPTGTLLVENGVLKDRGTAVGMIGPDYFHITYSYRPGQINIIDVRLSGRGAMSVITTSADAYGTNEVRATLAPQSPPSWGK